MDESTTQTTGDTQSAETVQAPTIGEAREVTIADPAPSELHTATVEEAARVAQTEQSDNKPGIDNLDDALKVIADLRKENARNRTNAKETAANEARLELAQKVALALGVAQDDSEEAPDPAEQVTALTRQIEETRTQADQSRLELAIYKTASAAGANPDALLDSRSFMSKLATIDPADTEAVKSAISEATRNNPTLKATQAVTPTRIDHAPGGNSHAEPKSLTEALSARYQ